MKSFFAALMIIVSVTLLAIIRLPGVMELRSYPTSAVELESKALQMRLDAATVVGAGKQIEKIETRKSRFYYEVELARRNFALEWFAIAIGLIGILMFVLQFLSKLVAAKMHSGPNVQEMIAREEYLEEGDFYRRIQELYLTRQEAMEWFVEDSLRTCSYCGAMAVHPAIGKVDRIQHVTFFRKVPQGAKDLRIVLGSAWMIRPAEELECGKCHHKIVR